MSAKKYPAECPLFRVEGLPDEEWNGAIVVGVGFYSQGLDVLVVSGGPQWFRTEATPFHTDWPRPLTAEATVMLDAVEVDRWYRPDGTRIDELSDDPDEMPF